MLQLLMVIFVVTVNCIDIEEQKNLFHIIEHENVVTSAVLEIISDFFEKETSELSFTYSAIDDNSSYFMLETIEDILIKLDSNFLISLQHATEVGSGIGKKIHNIIYVDDFKSFLKVLRHSTSDDYDYQGYYLIILTKYDKIAIKHIFETLWSFYIVNVNIITKEDEYSDEALMFTYFPYTRYYCEKVEPIMLNNYVIDIGFIKKNIDHFPNKLANLHKCPLKVATVDIPPFVIVNNDENLPILGLEGFLMIVLGKRMNFTMEAIVVHDSYLWGQLFENGTSTGAIEMVMTGQVNLTIGYYTSSPLRNTMMSASSVHYTSNLVWIIPPGRQITSLEKLIKPFGPILWKAVIILLIISFLIVTVIGFFSITIQNFVFGRNVRAPSLNIINVFFGGSLVQTPTRNFARTILCFFMLFCLIIRSSYQGALFQYMQMDSRTPVKENIHEMIEAGYHFYMYKNAFEHVNNFPWISSRSVFINRTDKTNILVKLLGSDFKGAFVSSEDHVAYWNKLGFPNQFYTICNTKIKVINLCIYMRKNSCLTAEINRQILGFNANGLMRIWALQYIDRAYLKERVKDPEPQQLQINQLLGGFQLYTGGITIGFVVFILEIIIKFLTKLFHKYSNRF
ncbi:unnamed protein product [Diamesa hyperborea]